MPPTTQTLRVSEPKVEAVQPQPQPAPRIRPFTIKMTMSIPC
jgi:hypothetical protein